MKILKIISLFCLLVFPNLAPALSEEEGGLTDHGGGGTFISRDNSSQLIFFDLYLKNPSITDTEPGDTLSLTRAGSDTKGEWLDQRTLKSATLLQNRISAWAPRAPNLMQQLQTLIRSPLPIVITPLKIPTISEIAVPYDVYQKANVLAVSGAYFDDRTQIIFIDIESWNQAGLMSQAALILHETLRGLQVRYGFGNEVLQNLVYQILTQDPRDRKNFIPDLFFDPSMADENAKPLRPGIASKHKTPAKLEIEDAIGRQVLGSWRAAGPLYPSGNWNEIPGSYDRVYLSPLNCAENLYFFHKTNIEEPFQCRHGVLSGVGGLLFAPSYEREPTISIGASFSGKEKEFSVDALKSQDGNFNASVKFHRGLGKRLRIKIEGEHPVEKEIEMEYPLEANKYSVRISLERKVIEVYFQTYENSPENSRFDMPTLSWNIPDSLLNKVMNDDWGLTLGKNVSVRFIAASFKNQTNQ